MTISGSIYFLGKYRPAAFEADTILACRDRMLAAIELIENSNLRSWLRERIHQGCTDIAQDNCASWSSDHCDRGVSYAKRPHDPWLDSIAATLPACPGLDYTA